MILRDTVTITDTDTDTTWENVPAHGYGFSSRAKGTSTITVLDTLNVIIPARPEFQALSSAHTVVTYNGREYALDSAIVPTNRHGRPHHLTLPCVRAHG